MSTLKLISKLIKDFSTRISRVAAHQGSQRLHQGRRIQTSLNQLLLNSYFTNLIERDYPATFLSTTTLAEITFEERKLALQRKRKQDMRILPFVTQYRPSVPNLKQILKQNWHLIQQQPLLRKYSNISLFFFVQKGQIPKGYILVRGKL